MPRPISTTRAGSVMPTRGRNTIASARLKIAVLAAIPMASDRVDVRLKRGALRRTLSAWRKSLRRAMGGLDSPQRRNVSGIFRLKPEATRLGGCSFRLQPEGTRLGGCGFRLQPEGTRLGGCGFRLQPEGTRLGGCGFRLQ